MVRANPGNKLVISQMQCRKVELQLAARRTGGDTGTSNRKLSRALLEGMYFLQLRVIAVHRIRIMVAIEKRADCVVCSHTPKVQHRRSHELLIDTPAVAELGNVAANFLQPGQELLFALA